MNRTRDINFYAHIDEQLSGKGMRNIFFRSIIGRLKFILDSFNRTSQYYHYAQLLLLFYLGCMLLKERGKKAEFNLML